MRSTDKRRWDWYRNNLGFWCLGLLNNASYVIMIAGANSILASSVGLVYFCAEFPTTILKITAPYWFHLVSYRTRMWLMAALMAGAYTVVACSKTVPGKLLGVVLCSLQGGLGEASCLGMCSLYDSRSALTCWSSGTGLSGVAGYGWVVLFHFTLGYSFKTTLLLANSHVLLWLLTYHQLLGPPEVAAQELEVSADVVTQHVKARKARQQVSYPEDGVRVDEHEALLGDGHMVDVDEHAHGGAGTSFMQRLRLTLSLWPYMVPLLLVYYAEYAMQSGAWTAIGFPVTSAAARHAFYVNANWSYQVGVFLSRSSGAVLQANRVVLWLMPLMQVGLLVFFIMDAVTHWWYDDTLLLPAFVTGCLGGAVYVNAFTLLSKEVRPEAREFSLSAASMGSSVGIVLADISAVFIQGCLFRVNNITGADFACGQQRAIK